MKNRDILVKHLTKKYTKVPNNIFNLNPKLQYNVIGLYILLLSLPESFEPTLGFIKNTLSLSKNTSRRYLQYLCSRGMIRKIRHGHFKMSDRYEFRPVKEWR